jgi:hypothetical protein
MVFVKESDYTKTGTSGRSNLSTVLGTGIRVLTHPPDLSEVTGNQEHFVEICIGSIQSCEFRGRPLRGR